MFFFGIKREDKSHALCMFFFLFNASKRISHSKIFFSTPTITFNSVSFERAKMDLWKWVISNYNHTLYYESVVKIQWTPAKLLWKNQFCILRPLNLAVRPPSSYLFFVRFNFSKLVLEKGPREIMWGVLTRRWSTLGISRAINSKLWSGTTQNSTYWPLHPISLFHAKPKGDYTHQPEPLKSAIHRSIDFSKRRHQQSLHEKNKVLNWPLEGWIFFVYLS